MRGWTRRPLSQLASRISDGSHNPPKGVEMSQFMMLSSKNVLDDELCFDAPRYLSAADFKAEDRRTCVAAGDVLLTIVGTIGRTAVVSTDAPAFTLQRSVAVIRPDTSLVDSRFLMYALMSGSDALNAQARGVAQKGIYLEALREFGIDHPPLPEQRRIVAILDEAFEGIATAKANAEKNLQNAQSTLDVVRQEAFALLAATFDSVRLGAVCAFENGDRGKNYPGKQHRVSHGVPFINAGHLAKAGIDFDSMDYISPDRFALLGNGKIRPGDILFCLRGSLGKFASVGDLAVGAIASSLVILRPGKTLTHDYLAAYLSSRQCADMIDRFKGGAAQPNLGATDLKKFELPLPPLPVQLEAASRLNELQLQTRSLEGIYSAKLAALEELKMSLLHQAFTGAL